MSPRDDAPDVAATVLGPLNTPMIPHNLGFCSFTTTVVAELVVVAAAARVEEVG